MNHVLYLSLTQALCILAFVGIMSAAGTYWIQRRQYWRDMTLVVYRMEERRKNEVRMVQQQSFAQGLTQGALRAPRLTAARLEEEYTKGWNAGTAQMGLNVDLAHRTGNSEQRN